MTYCFAALMANGDLTAGKGHFCQGAGRLDTLLHAVQPAAGTRRLAARQSAHVDTANLAGLGRA
jgi:hypothetical protein